MKLIQCPACHNDVSDEAKSCPRCGHPVSEEIRDSRATEEIARSELRRSSGQRALIVVAIIAAIVIFFAWLSTQTGSSSGSNSGENASKQGSPTTAQTQVSAAASASPAAPTLPTHNYTYEKGSVYGYQPQLSQNQINSGAASAPLVMVRYLGEHQGVYRAAIVDVADTSILSCSSPCSYITERDYYNNPYFGSQLVDKEIIPAGSTLAAAIMQDAMNGQLRVYGARRRAIQQKQEAARAAWLAEQKRRPPYVITAVALYAASGESAVQRKIAGRRLQITGIAIGEDPTASALFLRGGPTSGGIRRNVWLTVSDSDLGAVDKTGWGKSVTVLCQSIDFSLGYPVGNKCRLQK